MQQNAMQFTATQFGSEDEEARICLKSSTVTATTTTTTVVSSTAPFLSFPYGPHPPPPPNPHLYRRFSNSHQSQPLMPQSSSIMLLLCILPEKRDIIFYLANFSKFFLKILNKKSSENVFLSVPGCFFFKFIFYYFYFLGFFFPSKNSPLLHN
jgi:hypothetical protein